MHQNFNENHIQKLHIIILLVLSVIATGCVSTGPASTGPDHKVQVDSLKATKFKVDIDEDNEPKTEINGARINPVTKYGNDRLFNNPVKKQYSNEKGEFSLDFVNVAIEDFVSIVFKEMLNKHYVLDVAIKGNVTVQTRGQINSFQLLSIVESVLAAKGAVLISHRSYFDLIPLSKAKNYSFKPELYSARNLKPGYRMVIVPVNFVNPDDLKSILESVAPGAGHLKIDKERRAVVVTGSEQEISNVGEAGKIFDVSGLESKSIALLPVVNTEASIVKNEISKILTSQNKAHDVVLDIFERFNA